MALLIILLFGIGYIAIAFEHPLKLNKTVTALLMASLIWVALAIGFSRGLFDVINPAGKTFSFTNGGEIAQEGFRSTLLHHFGATSEILIFLIGAMTIVEIMDMHNGFAILKRAIHTQSKRKLLWIVGILGFLLSSVIDNLTATIVLVTLIQKLVPTRRERIWFASLIIIATNAGGAWSPIGDVTTIMLWIGKKITAGGLMFYVTLPSIICFVVPFLIASYLPVFKGKVESPEEEIEEEKLFASSRIILFLGLGMIVFVPIFKTLTDLPPYMGMMFSLAIVWMVSEYIQPKKKLGIDFGLMEPTYTALSRIDMSSILFFLGILMAVAGLETLVSGVIDGESVGSLRYAAEMLRHTIPNDNVVILFLGVLSAIIDNVPLVAATMGMYDYPIDAEIWHFIAYSAGTGGSMLIIGSAAGVAAMGMERIDFIWYFKKISWLALIGFLAGAGVFLLFQEIIFR